MATLTEGLLGGGLKGRSGNAVFVPTSRGTVVRERTIPHDPRTPAQIAARARQARAARAWGDLDPSAVAAWTVWARARGLQPNNAFATLYKVLLRLDPAAPAPPSPPAHAFFGDSIAIGVDPPSPSGSSWRGGQGGEALLFSASAPNAPGLVTEILLQPLASRNRRTYADKYRHAAYVPFADTLPHVVPCAPGWVACAYRFVNAATGQVTEIAELGAVRVGGVSL